MRGGGGGGGEEERRRERGSVPYSFVMVTYCCMYRGVLYIG